ncbi:uncharacterized protein LOC135202655 [Macrobrachium nipponense]|uniref:uncharacterized protein LOC135202655 n=1 Tax=Macrobrachium nipponense TaxID=159736 RepID=UPI0030C890F3
MAVTQGLIYNRLKGLSASWSRLKDIVRGDAGVPKGAAIRGNASSRVLREFPRACLLYQQVFLSESCEGESREKVSESRSDVRYLSFLPDIASAMSSQELPIEFEELSEEELSKMTIRRASGEKRLVRCSPGGILLPFTFVRLARNFHDFEFGSEDVVVATFPKSGTVWMGEILWAMTHFDSLATMETSAINARSYFFDLDFLHPRSSSDYSPLIAAFQEKCPGLQVDEGIMLQLAKADERRRVIQTHLQFHFFNESLLSKSKLYDPSCIVISSCKVSPSANLPSLALTTRSLQILKPSDPGPDDSVSVKENDPRPESSQLSDSEGFHRGSGGSAKGG